VRLARLEMLISEFGSIVAVADRAETARAYLGQIRNGVLSSVGRPRGIGDALARRLESGCGKPRGWMDTPLEDAGFDRNVTPAKVGKRPYPVISAIQAGSLREIADPYAPGDGFDVEYGDDKWSEWTFALEINGESMMPEFRPGDRVLIDPALTPNAGEFVAARNASNEATFKKYRVRGISDDGKEIFELVPLNPDFPTLRSDQQHLQVIGVLVEYRKRFRR